MPHPEHIIHSFDGPLQIEIKQAEGELSEHDQHLLDRLLRHAERITVRLERLGDSNLKSQ